MMENNQLPLLLACIPAFLYVMIIMRFTFGWVSLNGVKPNRQSLPATSLSVIIAARNEAESITPCLEALLHQDYPVTLFEVIIVDDHSTDKTYQIVNHFRTAYPGFPLLLLRAENQGKKSAIAQAIKHSSGQLIVTTDADCKVPLQWLRAYADCYEQTRSRCISGPVRMEGSGTFAHLQELEFMSLIASGAGSIGAGMPVMCNGANFCYEKQAFIEVNGFQGNERFASGDDIFLMHKISNRFGTSAIAFLKDRRAIVVTAVQPDVKSFFRQRMRWTSKSPGYRDAGIILTAISVFLTHIGLVLGLGYGLITGIWQPFFLIIVSKILIDFPLLVISAHFMQQKKLLLYFLPVQVLLPFYVLITTMGGLFSSVSWKGRAG
ncbi:MAG: glycosyltransferase [Bacteroidetes bacterium]|nr:glycosyltransferase [Bacteroidota bacterium]